MITTGRTYPNMGWLWIGAFVVILSIAPATSGHGADPGADPGANPGAKPETGAVKDDSSRNWFTDMFNISTAYIITWHRMTHAASPSHKTYINKTLNCATYCGHENGELDLRWFAKPLSSRCYNIGHDEGVRRSCVAA